MTTKVIVDGMEIDCLSAGDADARIAGARRAGQSAYRASCRESLSRASVRATAENELYLCRNTRVAWYALDEDSNRLVFEYEGGGYWFGRGHYMPAPVGFDYQREEKQ